MYYNKIILAVVSITLLASCAGTPPELRNDKKDIGEITPKVKAQYQLGVKHLRKNKVKQAYRIFKKLNNDYPSLFGPYANLGIIYLKQNNLEEAEKSLLMAIERNNKVAMAHNQLGIVYRQTGKFKKARNAYLYALRVDPNYAKAHLNLGILYDLYLVDLDKALFHYNKYQSLNKIADKRVKSWIADLTRRNKKSKKSNFSRIGQQ